MMTTRKLLALALAALFALVAVPAMAAESFTVTAVGDTDADIGTGWEKSFKVIKAAWTSNATTGAITVQTIPAQKGKVLMARRLCTWKTGRGYFSQKAGGSSPDTVRIRRSSSSSMKRPLPVTM